MRLLLLVFICNAVGKVPLQVHLLANMGTPTVDVFSCFLASRQTPQDALLVRNFSIGVLLAAFVDQPTVAFGLWAGVWYTVGWALWFRDAGAADDSTAHLMAAATFDAGFLACRLLVKTFAPKYVAHVAARRAVSKHASTMLVFGMGLAGIAAMLGYTTDGCGESPVDVGLWVGAALLSLAGLLAFAFAVAWDAVSAAETPACLVLLLGLVTHVVVPLDAFWVWPLVSTAGCGGVWVVTVRLVGWKEASPAAAAVTVLQGVTSTTLTLVDVYGGSQADGEGDVRANAAAVFLAAALLLVAAAAASVTGGWFRGTNDGEPKAAAPAGAGTNVAMRRIGGRHGGRGYSRLSTVTLLLTLVVTVSMPARSEGVPLLPDLVPDAVVLRDSLRVQHGFETTDACVVSEGCLLPGTLGTPRTLLRYSTRIWNVGRGGLRIGPPPTHNASGPEGRVYPDGPNGTWWDWHSCHQHWHLAGFARARLLYDHDGNHSIVGAQSLKVSFCLRDDKCVDGSGERGGALLAGVADRWSGERRHNCVDQGISPGCSDIYDLHLDCQWIDVTDVAPGVYVLEVEANPDQLFKETSYANNVVQVTVDLRPASDNRTPSYATRWVEVAAWGVSGVAVGVGLLVALVDDRSHTAPAVET